MTNNSLNSATDGAIIKNSIAPGTLYGSLCGPDVAGTARPAQKNKKCGCQGGMSAGTPSQRSMPPQPPRPPARPGGAPPAGRPQPPVNRPAPAAAATASARPMPPPYRKNTNNNTQ